MTYAALVHRARSSASTPTEAWEDSVNVTVAEADRTPVVTVLPKLRSSSDPETFARQVAEALFAWDAATLITRTDRVEQLVAVADPTGESTPGIVSDLDNYLPTQDAWAELTKYETRQWLSVDSVTTPSKWAEAEAQSRAAPRDDSAHDQRHAPPLGHLGSRARISEHNVASTVFLLCGPTYPECHLLRLSILDKPQG